MSASCARARWWKRGQRQTFLPTRKHDYTKALIDAEPSGRKDPVAASAPVVLEARKIDVTFTLGGGFLGRPKRAVHAVDGLSLTLHQGQTIGIVGESGSGKSTLARAVLRLLPSTGRFSFEGRDIAALGRDAMRPLAPPIADCDARSVRIALARA